MKKFFSLSLLVFLLPLFANAQSISGNAKKFRDNMQSFLREEGFAPYIDNDGSLCFKKEGDLYWIDFEDNSPVYIRFCRESLGTKDAELLAVMAAINDINTKIRALKCCYFNDQVSFAIESYCHVVEDFKYVFYSYLSILQMAKDEVKDAYSNYEKDLQSSNSTNKNSNINKNNSNNRSNSTSSSSSSNIPFIVSGRILNSQGNGIPYVWVTMKNNFNTIVETVQTDSNGRYQLKKALINYKLEISYGNVTVKTIYITGPTTILNITI